MPETLTPAEIKSLRYPLTLREAAPLLGYHRNTIHSWEKGLTSPSAAQLKALHVLNRCIKEYV